MRSARIFFLLFLSPGLLKATPISYEDAKVRLQTLWEKRYPLPARFRKVRESSILQRIQKGRRIYYYSFRAILSRPHRLPDGSIDYREDDRELEVWLLYSPATDPFYDILLQNEALLPGRRL